MIEAKDGCLISDDTLLSYRKTGKEIHLPPQNPELFHIRRIGAGALMNDRTVKSIHINEGISEIGPNAFSGCVDLEYITFPQSARYISPTAFTNTKKLTALSFYVSISEEKYQEIKKNSILLTNGEYILDPMILDNDLRKQIFSFVPVARWEIFPIEHAMGYFLSESIVYTFTSDFDKREDVKKHYLHNEDAAIRYWISEGERSYQIDDVTYSEDLNDGNVYMKKRPSNTAFVFLAMAFPAKENKRRVRIVIRRKKYFYHKIYRVSVDGKAFYMCFRCYFCNKKPVYIKDDSLIGIYSERGRVMESDPYYKEVIKKFNFAADYL